MLRWKDSLSRYNLLRHHGNNCKKINNGKSFLSHSILGGVGMSQGNRLSLSYQVLQPSVAGKLSPELYSLPPYMHV